MQLRDAVADTGTGLVAGFVGTKVMEPVAMKLYEWEPDEARQQEDVVRPGPPYQVAANKVADRLGLDRATPKGRRWGWASTTAWGWRGGRCTRCWPAAAG